MDAFGHRDKHLREARLRVDLLRTRLLSHLLQPCNTGEWEAERAEHLATLFDAEAEMLHAEAESVRENRDLLLHPGGTPPGRTADLIATVQASHGLC